MFTVHHHIFEHNGNKYVIDVEKMAAHHIDDETAAALTKITADPSFQLKPKIKAKLADLGLILEEKPEDSPSSMNYAATEEEKETVPVSSIALFVTQECNMDCIYCYGDGGNYGSSGNMTSDTAKKAIDWLIEQSGKVKKLGISFFGGEPLMNFPLMKEVVEYAKKMAKKKEKEFTFGITTNLSLLDEEKLAFLKENKITPLVSFDGAKEIQDKQRPLKNNKCSSYDTILPKIKKLLSVMPDVYCRATLLGETNPAKIREALCEIGFSKIHISSASSSLLDGGMKKSSQNIIGTLQMLESDAESFLKNVKNRNMDELQKQKNSGFLFEILASFLKNQKKYFPCGAGRGYVGISSTGDGFLCHRFVGTDEYKLGSVFDNKLEREPYLKKAVNTRKKCSECFAKYICGGGCYHDNLGCTESIFDPSENTCKLMQRTMELVSYISSNLSSDDKEYLVKEKIIPKKPLTMDEIKQKQQNVMAEMEELGLTEEEFNEVTGGLSQEEYKSKILSD